MPRQGGCARGERVKRSEDSNAATGTTAPAEPITDFAARANAAWVLLIRKVYQADPLECPPCHGPMPVIALIEDATVIRRILEHLTTRSLGSVGLGHLYCKPDLLLLLGPGQRQRERHR